MRPRENTQQIVVKWIVCPVDQWTLFERHQWQLSGLLNYLNPLFGRAFPSSMAKRWGERGGEVRKMSFHSTGHPLWQDPMVYRLGPLTTASPLFLLVHVFCLHVHLPCSCSTSKGHKMALSSLESALQMVLSLPMDAGITGPWKSSQCACHWSISPVLLLHS